MTSAIDKRWQNAFSILLAACVFSGPLALVLPVNAQTQPTQLKGMITKSGGLNTATFETPHGKLKVNLPDDASAGDTITGTVVAEPAGNTPEEKAQNEDELVGYVVSVRPKDPKNTPAINPPKCPPGQPVTCNLPPNCSGIDVCCDPPGTASANSGSNCTVPCAPTPPPAPPEGTCTMPTLGQCGKPFQIEANCDGMFSNSACAVGGTPCKLLAESPRKMVAESPRDIIGPTQLVVQEGQQIAQAPFCNVKVKLFCPKPVLQQGETSTLTATVMGLANVQNALLSIDNNSPDVLSLAGGNHQMLSLSPPQSMFSKMGSGGTDCPPVTSSPTAFPAPPGHAPPPVPPMGEQTEKGTTTRVYPGGTTIVTPPAGSGGVPIIIPPGLGEAPPKSKQPGQGQVIARQVEPNGTVVQVFENGFVSRTPAGGAPVWDKDPIF
ncbi:MAG: hypothetical protein C0507_25400 [Cyanobacteria bacterium PR.3.49]|nr:hypothetical protein [Cyanobacteria bacterium PR.3.49]